MPADAARALPLRTAAAALLARWSARWPGQCAVCKAWDIGALCTDCRQRFAAPQPRCHRCGDRLPIAAERCGRCLQLDQPPAIAATVAAVDYDAPWDALIAGFKFHHRLDLAGVLAGLLAQAVRDAAQPPPALVLPVPLGPARLRERGYNQAWELARRVARALNLPADARLLLRPRDTERQLELPRERRAANVRAAFAVEPSRQRLLQGASVALVDDVATTGATAEAAAAALRAAGATQVRLWVLAKTPPPGNGDQAP